MAELIEWDSFCVIVGSAAGALIGLQFVVMTLFAERPPFRAAEAGAAFATPTIVHFSAALCLSALLRAPWHSIVLPAILWGALGAVGILFMMIVFRRMKKQNTYHPEFEDWTFHAALPFAAYGLLIASAVGAWSLLREALFGVGAAMLLLLFIGIHNAWDNVAYFVFVKRPGSEKQEDTE